MKAKHLMNLRVEIGVFRFQGQESILADGGTLDRLLQTISDKSGKNDLQNCSKPLSTFTSNSGSGHVQKLLISQKTTKGGKANLWGAKQCFVGFSCKPPRGELTPTLKR